MGGGVGGGFFDVVMILLVLNYLWKCGYNCVFLMEMGLKLGVDVFFFLFGCNVFVEGVGEELLVLCIVDCWYVVIELGVFVLILIIFLLKLLIRDMKLIRIMDFFDVMK